MRSGRGRASTLCSLRRAAPCCQDHSDTAFTAMVGTREVVGVTELTAANFESGRGEIKNCKVR